MDDSFDEAKAKFFLESAFERSRELENRPNRNTVIGHDDLVDLQIELNRDMDVLDFIERF